MKIPEQAKQFKNPLKNALTLKRAPSSLYNNKIYHKAKTKFDIEKAHYEAELLLEEEEDNSELLKNQSMFERKDVSIFKFYCHLLECIDWLYLVLGILGILICALAGPVLSYLNATVYSKVGNTSEHRGDLTSEQIMKLNVKNAMESNIEKQMIYGSISLVGNIVGYGF